MTEKKFPATVRVYFDNVNSESYQTFLAYCEEMGKSIDVKRSMRPRIVTGQPRIITDEME